MDMYLVYEKNYAIDDVDCIEECEMKLYSSLETAKREISKSSEKCLFFAVNYNEKEDTYDGAFCVCLCKIPVEK